MFSLGYIVIIIVAPWEISVFSEKNKWKQLKSDKNGKLYWTQNC